MKLESWETEHQLFVEGKSNRFFDPKNRQDWKWCIVAHPEWLSDFGAENLTADEWCFLLLKQDPQENDPIWEEMSDSVLANLQLQHWNALADHYQFRDNGWGKGLNPMPRKYRDRMMNFIRRSYLSEDLAINLFREQFWHIFTGTPAMTRWYDNIFHRLSTQSVSSQWENVREAADFMIFRELDPKGGRAFLKNKLVHRDWKFLQELSAYIPIVNGKKSLDFLRWLMLESPDAVLVTQEMRHHPELAQQTWDEDGNGALHYFIARLMLFSPREVWDPSPETQNFYQMLIDMGAKRQKINRYGISYQSEIARLTASFRWAISKNCDDLKNEKEK